MVFLSGKARLDGKHIYNGLLETGCQQRDIDRAALGRLCTHASILTYLFLFACCVASRTAGLTIFTRAFSEMQHSSFQTTEAEIISAAEPRTGQTISSTGNSNGLMLLYQRLLGTLRGLLNGGPSRVAQAENARHFIKRFSGGVVASLAEQFVLSMLTHQHKLAMRPGDNETDKRENGVAILILPEILGGISSICSFSFSVFVQPVGINMGFEMIDANKWEITGKRECFPCRETNEKRACQSWAIGRGDGVNILPRAMSLGQGSFKYRNDRGELLT